DPKRIITNPDLSISQGAIRGWDKKSGYYFSLLNTVAKYYKFDIHKPFGALSQKSQNVILYGTGDTEIAFKYINDKGSVFQHKKPFEGVIPNFERRYRETDSDMMRQEFAKFLSHQFCTVCQGSRLRVEARHVFIEKYNLSEIAALSISQ